MMKKYFYLFVIFTNIVCSQSNQVVHFDEKLKENANSIVLSESFEIEIKASDKVIYTTKKRILFLNESGYKSNDFSEHYDKFNKIKTCKASVVGMSGNVIKEIKKSEFKDHSLVDGVSIFSDNRVLYLEYTPLNYPFIIDYESEIESSNGAILRPWYPLSNSNESVLLSEFIVKNETSNTIKFSEINFSFFPIEKQEIANNVKYICKNVLAFKEEQLANYADEIPYVKLLQNNAAVEGYTFNFQSWKTYGIDFYENFLKDNSTVSEQTKNKINSLILPNDSKIDKIKKVYKFVQDNTRYVSVQVGVGGWKPMPIEAVEKYGYGDCKALSNYTRAILKSIDIESYCTVIYGGEKKDINPDIVGFQGNHMILSVPYEGQMIFLECTSQTDPFGYLGSFTSDKNALILKSDGAEIVRTTKYICDENTQYTKAIFSLNSDKSIQGTVSIDSKNIQYSHLNGFENEDKKEIIETYQERYGHLNNLLVSDIKLINDKTNISFSEKITLKASNYFTYEKNNIILPLNVLNKSELNLSKYRNRKFSFSIKYGFLDIDEISIKIPSGYSLKTIPEKIEIKEKYGIYSLEIKKEQDVILFRRILKIVDGKYPKEEFENYRKFRETISKNDNIKLLIEKIN